MDAHCWLSYLKELYPVEFKPRKESYLLCLGIPYQVLQDTAKKFMRQTTKHF